MKTFSGWLGAGLGLAGVCYFFGAAARGQTAATVPAPESAMPVPLQVVASFQQQPTGVAVSRDGRVFVCFPNWSAGHTNSVVEVRPHQAPLPYPNGAWNDATAALVNPANCFVCVQSVYVDSSNTLWVLDPAAPNMGQVVVGGPKLVEINLASNTIERVYHFNGIAAPPQSYLNDVRVDAGRHFAYITDSGLGAIVVLNLKTGETRRVLNQVPETMGTAGIVIRVNGRDVRRSNGDPLTINCDGIALSRTGNTLFFEAPTNGNMYSIRTTYLRKGDLSDAALRRHLRFVAAVGPTDGFAMGPEGAVYITSVEDHSIKRVDPSQTPPVVLVADDPRLIWPDSLAWSTTGELYVTASQIPRMPQFNGGQNRAQLPYHLFRCVPFVTMNPVDPDL